MLTSVYSVAIVIQMQCGVGAPCLSTVVSAYGQLSEDILWLIWASVFSYYYYYSYFLDPQYSIPEGIKY